MFFYFPHRVGQLQMKNWINDLGSTCSGKLIQRNPIDKSVLNVLNVTIVAKKKSIIGSIGMFKN